MPTALHTLALEPVPILHGNFRCSGENACGRYVFDPSSLWCKSRFLDEKDFVIHSDRS